MLIVKNSLLIENKADILEIVVNQKGRVISCLQFLV